MIFLKQSTAANVMIGPAIDDTDFKTAETTVIADSDIELSKNGADYAAKTDTTDSVSKGDGFHLCELDATDTGTLGRLKLKVAVSGVLIFWEDYMVVPANVYDSLFSTDKLQVDMVEVSSDETAADNLEAILDGTGAKMYLTQLQINATGADNAIDIDQAGTGKGIEVTTADGDGIGVIATGSGHAGLSISSVNYRAFMASGTHGNLMSASAAGQIGLLISSADGIGVEFQGKTSGFHVEGTDTNSPAIQLTATGTADAIESTVATGKIWEELYTELDAHLVNGHGAGAWTTADVSALATQASVDVIDGIVDAILVDTGTTIPATLTTMESKIDTIDGIVDAILVDTAEIGAAGAGLTAIIGSNSDTLESLSDQLDGIGAGSGAALNFSVDDDSFNTDPLQGVTNVGNEGTTTFANTKTEDGVPGVSGYHSITDVGNVIDVVYQVDVSTVRTATEILFKGYLAGNNDDATISVFNGTDWDQIGALVGKVGTTNDTLSIPLLSENTVSGSVYIRFQSADDTVLNIDQFLISAVNIGQNVGYANGAIWIDTVNGSAGQVLYVNGVADNPSSVLLDALTISSLLGILRFEIAPASIITLIADAVGMQGRGNQWLLDPDGFDISDGYVNGAIVSGSPDITSTGVEFDHCELGTMGVVPGHFHECAITATLTTLAAGTFLFDNCFSGIAGSATPTWDFGAAIGATALNMRHYSGGIEIQNMKAGDTMSLEGDGQLVINANCTGGSISIRGNFKITDNASEAVTINELANITSIQGKTYGAASFDRTTDSLEAVRDEVGNLNNFDPANETVDVGKISGDAGAADSLEAILDGTGDTLYLDQLYVDKNKAYTSDDAAIVAKASSNGEGLKLIGSGAGDGIYSQGGDSANGIYAKGPTAGSGLRLEGGTTSGYGAYIRAQSADYEGIYAIGYGLGDGAKFESGAGGGYGLRLTGVTGDIDASEINVIDGIVDNILVDTTAGGAGPWTTATGFGDATEAKQDTIIANLATVDGIVDAILVDTAGLNGDAMRGTNSALLAASVNVAAGIVESNVKQIDDQASEATRLQQALLGTISGAVNTIPAASTTLLVKSLTNDAVADLNITDVLKNRVIIFTSGVCKGMAIGITDQAAAASDPITLTTTTMVNFANIAVDDTFVIV